MMPKFYGMSDAMLVTLKADPVISMTLPGKVQSYMAAGKPIIGAIDGETRKIVEMTNCGLCCGAEDVQSLANIIKTFIDYEDKARFGLNGKLFYEAHFSKQTFIERLENTLTF